jgi:hypothetical protein
MLVSGLKSTPAILTVFTKLFEIDVAAGGYSRIDSLMQYRTYSNYSKSSIDNSSTMSPDARSITEDT